MNGYTHTCILKCASIFLATFGLVLAGCTANGADAHDHSAEDGHDHAAEASHGHEGHDHGAEASDAHSSDEIIIEPERAAMLGIRTAPAELQPFAEVLQVSGTVLPSESSQAVVSAPSSGILTLSGGIVSGKEVRKGQTIATVSGAQMAGGDATESARLAYEAAARELERVKPLHAEGIVSTRDYNTALQAYQTAKAAYVGGSAAGRSAVAPISGAIVSLTAVSGQYVEAGATICTIAASGRLTLKAEVPERLYGSIGKIVSANITLPSDPGQAIDLSTLGATVVSSATPVASNGYVPVFIEFNNDGGRIVAGSVCSVSLIGSNASEAIVVPLSALSEQQGRFFVYVQVDAEGYERKPVEVGRRDGLKAEILSGLSQGENVVVEGTTMVRLAATSSVVPEGHSHNH